MINHEITLTVDGAASLLHLHPDNVRRKAANYELPHAKVGGKLLFIESDLIVWLRSRYREREQCHLSSVKESGILTLPSRVKECADLLKPAQKSKHKS